MSFENYAKPGPGINKRDPNEPRIKIFWDVFPRKLWNLFKLNSLYLLVSLPFIFVTMIVAGVISLPLIDSVASELSAFQISGYDSFIRFVVAFLFMIFFGLGPVTCGYTYIIREYACERPCWLISEFFERIKLNLKQGVLLWLIDLAVLYVFTVTFSFYGQTGNSVFQYIILVMTLIYMMMHIYIYQIMITFDLSLRDILKNSFLVAMAKAPMSLLIIVCNIAIFVAIPLLVIMSRAGLLTTLIVLLADILFLPAVTGFVTGFCIIPGLNQYLNSEKNN